MQAQNKEQSLEMNKKKTKEGKKKRRGKEKPPRTALRTTIYIPLLAAFESMKIYRFREPIES